MSKVLRVGLGLFAGVLVVLLVLKARADRHYFDAYDAGVALNARVAESEERERYRREKVYFDSTPGEAVPTLVTLPKEGSGPFPCIVFLHGIGQDKDFLDVISPVFNEAGFAMTSYDQYTRGERKLDKGLGPIAQAQAFRERACKTVNDTRRLADYLQSRPDIDPERLYLVGASYGAITGSTAAAFDTRFKAVVLVYGGAGISKLLDATAIRGEMAKQGVWGLPLFGVLKPVVAYLLAPADPIHYAHRIAPRPVLLQNGKTDVLISTAAAEALQGAVQEPKKITWYEGDHIGLDEATVWRVLGEGIAWLKEQDALVQGQRAGA